MKVFDSIYRPGARGIRFGAGIALAAALYTGSVTIVLAASVSPANVQTEKNVDVLALKWFAQMQAGQIDREQLATEYGAQLTDSAVQGMSRYLKEYKYGASPTRAEVMKTRTIGGQTLYLVKLIFPRGDASSLMFGFNAEGKITGISLLSMAGD